MNISSMPNFSLPTVLSDDRLSDYNTRIESELLTLFKNTPNRKNVTRAAGDILKSIGVDHSDDIYAKYNEVMRCERPCDSTLSIKEKELFFGGIPTSRHYNGLVKLAAALV
eukprot:6013700-Prymnesium_polylepis.2